MMMTSTFAFVPATGMKVGFNFVSTDPVNHALPRGVETNARIGLQALGHLDTSRCVARTCKTDATVQWPMPIRDGDATE